MTLQEATDVLTKAVWDAVDKFGEDVQDLPEEVFCERAADVLEDRSRMLRDRLCELVDE